MARIKRAVNAVKKRRKVFKLSKGYYGAKSKLRQYLTASLFAGMQTLRRTTVPGKCPIPASIVFHNGL